MNNTTLQLKIKQRLNKLASNDYDNIECWQIVEAFNKAQLEWCRRNLHGMNQFKEGDEDSISRIDDLQQLITTSSLSTTDFTIYVETGILPVDYFRFKRVALEGNKECCPDGKPFVVYLAEEINVDIYLRDINKRPNYDWGETFITFINNKIRIYTNDEFQVKKAELIYYREPVKIEIAGCGSPYTGLLTTADVPCEFKDSLCELLIDEAAAILAGDIESMTQIQRLEQNVEKNN